MQAFSAGRHQYGTMAATRPWGAAVRSSWTRRKESDRLSRRRRPALDGRGQPPGDDHDVYRRRATARASAAQARRADYPLIMPAEPLAAPAPQAAPEP